MEHKDAIQFLRAAQAAQRDMRRNAREAQDFVNKRDGQWEDQIIRRFKGKPRYTDDRTNPIVNQIVGELDSAEFGIKIRPSGGEATQDNAKVLDGLIRNIRNISKFDQTKEQAGRNTVEAGLSGWEIDHDYCDEMSFDQDLIIRPIHDFVDRVWMDPTDFSMDGGDSQMAFKLDYLSKEAYEETYPKAKGKSLGNDSWTRRYWFKAETIIIGKVYYLEEEEVRLYQMSDGSVHEGTEKFDSIVDEMAEDGITVVNQRVVKAKRCMTREFDADGWLGDEEETIFRCIPIIPCYGHFKVVEDKVLFRGVVEKLMDIQRVHNYAFSRDVEEVALSPRKKYWMSREQAEGNEESLRTMNTNMDPVQFYNAIPNQPPPMYMGGGEINAAVRTLVDSTDQGINKAAGMFGANMGDIQHLQSGTAIEKQIDRGNNGTSVYFNSMEAALVRTGEILVKHIPKVYDATRKARLLQEDGSYEMVILNDVVVDEESGTPVTKNDISRGQYDVSVDIGPSYKNRQQEASETFIRAAEKNPELLSVAADIWVKNITAPGFDKIAERYRAMALQNGVIPESQMTEEELAKAQEAAQQPQPPSIEELALQVQMMEAQTAQMAEQNRGTEHEIKIQELQAKFAQEQEKTQSKLAVDSAKINQEQQRIDQDGAKMIADVETKMRELALKMADLEQKHATDLNSEVKNNMLVFNVETGDFEVSSN